MELTLVGRVVGDHLTEGLVIEKDSQYKKGKAEEALINHAY